MPSKNIFIPSFLQKNRKRKLEERRTSSTDILLPEDSVTSRPSKMLKFRKSLSNTSCKDTPKWAKKQPIRQSSTFLKKTYYNVQLMMKSANGTLYSAYQLGTDRPVCLKQIEKSTTNCYETISKDFKLPSEIFFHFKAFDVCPAFVVEPIEWIEFKNYYVIVMEKPPNSTDLFEISKKWPHGMHESIALNVLDQLIKCTKALHDANICHRDIKDENVLINTQTLQIKLIDFGSATQIEPVYRQRRGTPEYWPPEFHLEGSSKPDELTVWSIGAVFYILLTGEWNFKAPTIKRNYQKEANVCRFSQSTTNLVNGLLCPNPKQRFSLSQL